ncbi:hypothetical protein EJ08DRAFT_588028 [Tothia fuscella]|uniref:Vesicle-mediated transport protein Vid24 n=1 Tax=Tothia fuscella TaxID=1048955 RepID=A0A9P4TYW2_9PEZI|nr:hypothetical protein EJ08DRAFT_588028 [Tothia fuscella]
MPTPDSTTPSTTAELRHCLEDSQPLERVDSAPIQTATPPPEESGDALEDEGKEIDSANSRHTTPSNDDPRDIPSPVSNNDDTPEAEQGLSQTITSPSIGASSASQADYPNTGLLISPFPKTRFLPNSTSSFLKPGSRFAGTQQSDRQKYDVQVEIQHVDMAESFLCGYLRIQGLTDDHPTLTTYFEGEIIGTKYTFQTRHAEWGSNEKVDMQHWGRFPAWRPLAKQAKRPDFSYKNFAQRENVFMRWKEYFLVPDHRVRTISGASFDGFYYICFNQVEGSISGIYFHAKSEKYQQLELKHVEDNGCMGTFEFR